MHMASARCGMRGVGVWFLAVGREDRLRNQPDRSGVSQLFRDVCKFRIVDFASVYLEELVCSARSCTLVASQNLRNIAWAEPVITLPRSKPAMLLLLSSHGHELRVFAAAGPAT